MARTDYGAIQSTVIKDTSDSIREVNGTSALIAPSAWGTQIRTMVSGSKYQQALDNFPVITIPQTPIASFNDGAGNVPFKEILAYIQATQAGSGDPYPAGGGKNKLDPSLLKDQVGWNIIELTLKPNTAYTMSSNMSSALTSELPAYFVNEDTNPGSGTLVYSGHSVTVTTLSTGYLKIQQRRVSGTDSFQNYQWQIEENSTATSYAPYSNIRPISGVDSLYVTRTGKNLLNPHATVLKAYINGSSKIVAHASNRTVILPCKPNTTYAYTWNRKVISGNDDSLVASFTSEPTIGSVGTTLAIIYSAGGEATFTTGANDRYFAIKFANIQNTTPQDTLNDSQLELGSTATSYEQFKGDPYINFFDGLIKGTYGYIDLSNIASFSYDGVSKRWQSMITGIYNFPSRNGDIVAEKYVADITATTGDENKMFTVGGAIYIYSTDGTTPPSGKLIYPLATPTTPTITPIEINMLQSAFGTEGTSAYIMLGGTYYGGYVNVPTGLLTVTYLKVDLGSLAWQYNATYNRFYAPLETKEVAVTTKPNYLCDIYKTVERMTNASWSSSTDDLFITQINNTNIGIRDNSYSGDYTQLKTDLSGHYICYELATPQTVQLTPAQIEQLLGQNNVFCSSGDVAVKYYSIGGEIPSGNPVTILEDGVVSANASYQVATFDDISDFGIISVSLNDAGNEHPDCVCTTVQSIIDNGGTINLPANFNGMRVQLTLTSVTLTWYDGSWRTVTADIKGWR